MEPRPHSQPKSSVSHPKAHFPESSVAQRGPPKTKLSHPGSQKESSRGCFWARPPPRTRWKPNRTAAHNWHPSRLEPRRTRHDSKPLRGETPGRPRTRPPTPSRGALSGRSGRTPGRRQAQPSWGPSPRASAPGAGASSPGGRGAARRNRERREPGHTHICQPLSKALALQAWPIGARAGREGPGAARGGPVKTARGGREATGEGPGPPPAGFRRGQGSQKAAGSLQRPEPRLTRGAE